MFPECNGLEKDERRISLDIGKDSKDYIIVRTKFAETIYKVYKYQMGTKVLSYMIPNIDRLREWKEKGWTSRFKMIQLETIDEAGYLA